MTATGTVTAQPLVSVIVPARNEQACLGACLESLAAQQLADGIEIIVVDDHSTDRTREIAESFERVRVIEAGPLPDGWTGKNNAVATGARAARGQWLLFTDADTVHLPGSLARAVEEGQSQGAAMLSYSPEQTVVTFWEKATLPVVFAELARQYPPSLVSDPKSPAAAANGQYLLVTREAYDGVGGHAAVARDILEDVAFARVVKRSGRKILFRYAPDAVRTRMYRNFHQLREGWTKNLALLFPNPSWLAIKTLVLWGLAWTALAMGLVHTSGWAWDAIFAAGALYLASRVSRAHFSADANLLAAIFGMPMFAWLLLRSKHAHRSGGVQWKGRKYPANAPATEPVTSNTAQSVAAPHSELRTEN